MMTPPPPGHILDEFRVEETPCKGICSQFNRKNGGGGGDAPSTLRTGSLPPLTVQFFSFGQRGRCKNTHREKTACLECKHIMENIEKIWHLAYTHTQQGISHCHTKQGLMFTGA